MVAAAADAVAAAARVLRAPAMIAGARLPFVVLHRWRRNARGAVPRTSARRRDRAPAHGPLHPAGGLAASHHHVAVQRLRRGAPQGRHLRAGRSPRPARHPPLRVASARRCSRCRRSMRRRITRATPTRPARATTSLVRRRGGRRGRTRGVVYSGAGAATCCPTSRRGRSARWRRSTRRRAALVSHAATAISPTSAARRRGARSTTAHARAARRARRRRRRRARRDARRAARHRGRRGGRPLFELLRRGAYSSRGEVARSAPQAGGRRRRPSPAPCSARARAEGFADG